MKVVCLDTEHSTGAFRPWETGFYLTCCGVIIEEGGIRHEELIWFDHRDVEATVGGTVRLQSVVDDADLLIFHNGKHDISVLHGFGISFNDTKIHCTMVCDYLIKGQNKELSYKLDAVAARYELGQKKDEVKSYWDRGIDTFNIPDWILGSYCLQDCNLTLDIYHKQVPRIEEAGLQKVVDLQNEYIYVLTEMEDNGLNFNKEVANEIIKINQGEVKKYADAILDGVEYGDKINLSSHQQLSALLYGGLLKLSWLEWTVISYKTKCYSDYREKKITKEVQFPGLGFVPDKKRKKKDGYYKVDKDTIRTLPAHTKAQRNIKRLLVEYSKHSKIVSTLQGRKGDKGLLSKVQTDGYLHPSLNQTVTSTGRLSSSDPNGQNLFPAVKKAFTPRYDGIMQVDLSQIEWRNAAWLSQDKNMIEEINSGVDQHVATVTNLMGLEFISKTHPQSKKNRNHAKVFNFRINTMVLTKPCELREPLRAAA